MLLIYGKERPSEPANIRKTKQEPHNTHQRVIFTRSHTEWKFKVKAESHDKHCRLLKGPLWGQSHRKWPNAALIVHREGCCNWPQIIFQRRAGAWEETLGQSDNSQHTLWGWPLRKILKGAAHGRSATAMLLYKSLAIKDGVGRLKAK